ncbi:MAG: DMP19 family protein [Nitrospira sp.]|nr:DMP19 family protein [Nitrospira sp.]MDH4371344.1 DMP19 family protein [Nitrospira sp.]MDH5348403.1 DMP19 family protein [Nitrospira sp.]MDH5498185.1 DMP19 family protein [Nitrospira sp.]MDH5725994.1 DMP19 family protein [Nitrospira sp.]
MSEKKWLDGYSGQTTIELISLQGEYQTDSIVLAFEEALDQKAERIGQSRLTADGKVVLAIEALEREVNNGGYGQFFINSSKSYVPIVVDALSRIGCSEVALLTQHVIDALGIDGQVTVEAIDSVMEEDSDKRDEKLGECDEQYYKVAGDLAGPLLEFIKKNKLGITVKG